MNMKGTDDKEKNRLRQKRYRVKHGNFRVVQWYKKHPEKKKLHAQNYIHRHPERHKDSLTRWRKLNPGKVKLQNARAKAKIKRRRAFKKWYWNNTEIVVAVTCIFCDKLILGCLSKKLCNDCKNKWQRTIPANVLDNEKLWLSFHQLPENLLIWRRIIQYRNKGIYRLD